jgi:hypothetical protein
VEQARDIVVKDTQLETAIVGEDILLTPRSPDAQPDAQSDALLAAGDHTTALTLQTHTVLQWLVSVQDAFSCAKLRHAGLPHCPNVLLPVCAVLECQAVHHLYNYLQR